MLQNMKNDNLGNILKIPRFSLLRNIQMHLKDKLTIFL